MKCTIETRMNSYNQVHIKKKKQNTTNQANKQNTCLYTELHTVLPEDQDTRK